jgi:glycosyltransferase involved in cell wall biosynthesis
MMNKNSNNTILMVIPTLMGGGAERVFNNLANSFAEKNIRVILITNYKEKISNDLHPFITLITPRSKRLRNRYLERILRLFFTLISIIKVLLFKNPNSVISTLDEANILTYLAFISVPKRYNVPFIYREANIIIPERYSGFLGILARKVEKKSIHVIANSHDTRDSLIEVLDVQDKKITVIGNPVYNQKLIDKSFEKYTKSIYEFKSCKFILNVARLEPQKDQKTLLLAFSKVIPLIPDLELVILGEGSLEIDLKSLSNELGISEKVRFLGFCQNPYPFYRNSELFVLSSIYEGFGNVLVEALSFGKPVVSANCMGGPSFILQDGKYGSLVDVGDSDALAKEIVQVLTKQKIFPMELQIERAKDFSINSISDEYLALLSNLKETNFKKKDAITN